MQSAARLQAEQALDGILSHVCRTMDPAKAADMTVGKILMKASDGDIAGRIKKHIEEDMKIYADPTSSEFPEELSDETKSWLENYIAHTVSLMTRHTPTKFPISYAFTKQKRCS